MPFPIRNVSSASRKRYNLLLVAAALVLASVCFLLWRGRMPLEGVLRYFAGIDAWPRGKLFAANPQVLRKYYSQGVGIALMIAGLLVAAGALWGTLTRRMRDLGFRAVVTLACSSAVMVFMLRMEFTGAWSPPQMLMANPQSLPVVGHRLLFVWIADAFWRTAPRLLPIHAYYLAQCIAGGKGLYPESS